MARKPGTPINGLRRYVSIADLAATLGVGYGKIKARCDAGQIHCVRDGGRVLIPYDVAEAYIASLNGGSVVSLDARRRNASSAR